MLQSTGAPARTEHQASHSSVYIPVNLAGRFSTKAWAPSRWSCVFFRMLCPRRSKLRAVSGSTLAQLFKTTLAIKLKELFETPSLSLQSDSFKKQSKRFSWTLNEKAARRRLESLINLAGQFLQSSPQQFCCMLDR